MKRFFVYILLILLVVPFQVFGQEDSLEYRTEPFQFTFLFPPFSTNGAENAQIVNNVSLNLFTGVSGGVDGFEVGTFINVDRYYMKGFQGAGFGNVVGGDVDGFQLAGFYNTNAGDVKYVQGAGFVNVTGGKQFGLQGAGFGNVVGGSMSGFQGAGFMNIVGDRQIGVQGAGFMNIVGGKMTGLQGSGFMNIAGGVDKGIQGAGFMNISGDGKVNLQLAGFMNVADEVEGIQASGFINRAGYVRGLQASGFINVCDSIDGIPLGFINIVKHNGYRKFELSASEIQFVQASFKMGVKKFYTVYSIGKLAGPSSRYMIGAGLGTRLDLAGKTFLNLEAMSYQELWINDPRTVWFFNMGRFNQLNQVHLAFGRDLGNRLEAFVGPTLNVSVAHTYPYVNADIPWEALAPRWAFYNRTFNNAYETNVAIWLGLKGGLRF